MKYFKVKTDIIHYKYNILRNFGVKGYDMTSFESVISKIKDIISQELGAKKVYDKDVAEALGLKHLSFATMKRRGRIPYKEILNFCAKRKISINWLLFDQLVESIQEETEKYTKIYYFKDIYASAGGGALNYEEDAKELTIDSEILYKLGVHNPKEVEALNVIGDSMEPTLKNEDIVFINRNQKDFRKGGIYIVSTPNGLFIKRLQFQANGMLSLISDNSSYSDELVHIDDVEVLGKVVGVLSSDI